ncbi:espin-like protein [Serinus canaria]|uniref:espin-like protein n=1 Tax=Serinus canaria TaxID=9135 RepID=UPI0021CC88E8|nr:espin-like protein [Serinus canaria]
MAEVRQEPAAPRAVRVCRICVDFLQSPAAAVEPCGHVFCHACIQPQAAPDAAATCPTCQGPIGGIRLLQGQDNRAGVAPRRPRRRLHPFVVRWRQRQQQQARQDPTPFSSQLSPPAAGGGPRLCPQQPPGPAGDGARQVGAGGAEAPKALAAGQDPGAFPRPLGRSLARPAAPGSLPRLPYPFEPPMTLSAQDGAPGPAGSPRPDPAEIDAESLVPTHDERGRLIPEWKRQVMVRRLRARLADEDPAGGQVRGARGAGRGAGCSWSFSPSHQAVLGPFGELLTEADLHQLEMAVESLRLRRRGEVYQGELRRLVRELRALLPAPLLSISVRSPPPAPGLPLPLWCGRLAGAVNSLAALLGNAEGLQGPRGAVAAPAATCALPVAGGHPREPGGSLAQREIRQCGVCVRSLRGAFEPAWGAAGSAPAGAGEAEAASDSGISCEEAFSDGGSPRQGKRPGPEWGSLRKERIVMLFLSHWRRSAYAPLRPAAEDPRETAGSGARAAARLARQRAAIQKLLSGWRDAASRRPPPPPPARTLLSPEQFVSAAGGGPAEYESLSLELFMLGYFRILEQDLSAEERRGRHLLCFEVFEQLGRHGWRAVRAFHRAVIDEIAAGRRGWSDSFDDIKARYFGTLHSPAQRPGQPAEEGDEICRYIDRSFAFWKEKEAEIFSLEE